MNQRSTLAPPGSGLDGNLAVQTGCVNADATRWLTYVGVGLGDPGLLTLAGAQAVREATVLAVDDPGLLARLSEFNVVARHDARTVVLDPLSEATERAAALLAALGPEDVMVRLAVGDPLVDAGLGPEASACVASGVRVALLPAVSAVTAAPTLAGVYGTADYPTRFVRLTDGAPVHGDFSVAGATLVDCIAECLPQVAATALASGHPSDELALVVAGAGTQDEASWTVPLGEMARPSRRTSVTAAIAHLAPTSHILVGLGTAAHRDIGLDYRASRPLLGWRVLVPRTREACQDLTRQLVQYGATPQTLNTLALEPPRNPQPMDRAIRGLVDGRYRWVVFASLVVTRILFDAVAEYGLDARAFSGVRIAAASPMSKRLLQEHGLVPEVVAPEPTRGGTSLISVFPEYDKRIDPMDRVLVPCAAQGAPVLADGLRREGWLVDEVVVCRTVRAAPPPADVRAAIKAGRFDAVVFTSPAAVRNLLGLAGKPAAHTIVAAMGAATAEVCREYGLTVAVTAHEPGCRELAGALAGYAAEHRTRSRAR